MEQFRQARWLEAPISHLVHGVRAPAHHWILSDGQQRLSGSNGTSIGEWLAPETPSHDLDGKGREECG